MNSEQLEFIVSTVLEAIQQGRIGFSTQHVNAVGEGNDVLYTECLGRLIGLDGSVISAGEFIAPLEAFGYAPYFDRHMLSLVFDWLSNNAFASLGCNISADNFSNEANWALLYAQLCQYQAVASRLILEITESFPIQPRSGVTELIQCIRKLGYRVAIDDFGTGFSTPEVLLSMSVDIVKIDALFLGLHRQRKTSHLLRHMVGLASCVAPTIVVEGVETRNQLGLARAVGATHVQGYLLSDPAHSPIFGGLADSMTTKWLM